MQLRSTIPNFITLCNLLCGFMALIQGNLLISVGFIALGMVFDILDGLVARMLHSPSEIGKELDSLADMVTFGLVPAYFYYTLAEETHLGIIASFALISASAYRLAKFNTIETKSDFQGLPTPASTAILVGIFIAYANDQEFVLNLLHNNMLYILIPLALSLFMVSNISMFSIKKGVLSMKQNPGPLLCVLVLVITFFVNKEMAVLITGVFYIFLSLILNVIKR